VIVAGTLGPTLVNLPIFLLGNAGMKWMPRQLVRLASAALFCAFGVFVIAHGPLRLWR